MSTAETETLLTTIFLVAIPVTFLLYALPGIIAYRRRHPDRFAILAVNLVLGATGIGWVGALVWALGEIHPSNEAGGAAGSDMSVDNPQAMRLVGPPPLTTSAAVAAIERLSALRASGALSEPEFAELKADVLRRVQAGAST